MGCLFFVTKALMISIKNPQPHLLWYNVLTPGQHCFWGDSLSLCTSLSLHFSLPFPSHPSFSLKPYVPLSLFLCCMYHLPSWCCLWKSWISDWWLRQKQPLQYVSHMTWFLFFIWQQSTELFLSKLKIPGKKMLHSAWNTSEIKDLKRFSFSFCDGILEGGVIAMANGLGQGWPGVRRVLSVTWW